MVLWGKTYGISGCVYIYIHIYIYIDIWIPGSSKKTAILWSTTLQTSCPPRPPTHVVLWILCLAAFKKNSHFCWWCAALPITTLKLGLWGKVRYLCGFLWMAVFFFFKNPVYIHIYVYMYIYGYIYIYIHTHILGISWGWLSWMCIPMWVIWNDPVLDLPSLGVDQQN